MADEWWKERFSNELAILAALHQAGGVITDPKGRAQAILKDLSEDYKIAAHSSIYNTITKMVDNGVLYRSKTQLNSIEEIGIIDLGEYAEKVEELIAHKSEIVLSSPAKRNKMAQVIHVPNVVQSKPQYTELELRQMHRINQLEKAIAEMEPFLRQFDVFEYVTKEGV